eukprot:GEMP01087435.1.p1 GENE.GEMP01087435.1~~GEMP01087435.1.p1  ORF type:complete len:242 (+),score=41.70 GEMP01087435.1:56-727(+)
MKRVLYLHGLESGAEGLKATYLRDHVDTVVVPDLEVSLFDVRKPNCLLRSPWMLGVFGGALAGTVSLPLALLAVPLGFGCLRQGLVQLLQKCTDIAEEVLKAEQEFDLIVGSSWGGAVALKLLERNPSLTTPCIVLAPALGSTGKYRYIHPRWLPSTLAQSKVAVLHGTEDAQIPVEMSRMLQQNFPEVNLIEIQGGDHRLNQVLYDGTLLELMEKMTSSTTK